MALKSGREQGIPSNNGLNKGQSSAGPSETALQEVHEIQAAQTDSLPMPYEVVKVPETELRAAERKADETADMAGIKAEELCKTECIISPTEPVAAAEVVDSDPEKLQLEVEAAVIKAESELELKQQIFIETKWYAQYEAVVGCSHRKANPPIGCQDSSLASVSGRPLVISADGAGSSVLSELGSQTVVSGMQRLLVTLERQLAKLLDNVEYHDCEISHFALMLAKHAKGLLTDLAVQHRRPLRDFRCTLLLAVVGSCRSLWLKIGDGALVGQTVSLHENEAQTQLQTLGMVGKGEFANFTTFIDENLQPADVQFGVIDSQNLIAVMAMSDGAAEKFVSNDGTRVAGRLADWAQMLRNDSLPRTELTTAFYADDFRKGHSGDDCCLAIVARTYHIQTD